MNDLKFPNSVARNSLADVGQKHSFIRRPMMRNSRGLERSIGLRDPGAFNGHFNLVWWQKQLALESVVLFFSRRRNSTLSYLA